MKSKTKTVFAFALLLLNFQPHALAGFAGGPYVIWVNLSNNTAVNEMVTKHITEKDDCIPPDAKFYLKERPDGITDELVKNAVIKNDKSSIKVLEKLMRQPFGKLENGFDGIIAYDEHTTPRFSSVVTGWHAVARKKVPANKDSSAAWDTFCVLIPPITRAP